MSSTGGRGKVGESNVSIGGVRPAGSDSGNGWVEGRRTGGADCQGGVASAEGFAGTVGSFRGAALGLAQGLGWELHGFRRLGCDSLRRCGRGFRRIWVAHRRRHLPGRRVTGLVLRSLLRRAPEEGGCALRSVAAGAIHRRESVWHRRPARGLRRRPGSWAATRSSLLGEVLHAPLPHPESAPGLPRSPLCESFLLATRPDPAVLPHRSARSPRRSQRALRGRLALGPLRARRLGPRRFHGKRDSGSASAARANQDRAGSDYGNWGNRQ